MHEYAPLAITLVAIFAGILLNKHDLNRLKADQRDGFERVDKQIDEVKARLLAIEVDLGQFYSITGSWRLVWNSWRSVVRRRYVEAGASLAHLHFIKPAGEAPWSQANAR